MERPDLEHLKSAFLAMEPPNSFISLARSCGGGCITPEVQTFILDIICNGYVGSGAASNSTYVRNLLKKVIVAAESTTSDAAVVVDGLYEQFAHYMTLPSEDDLLKEKNRIYKQISFLYPNGFHDVSSVARSLVVSLQCSLNLLEGDTGCAIWPSSLFLSEFILSHPAIFSNKFCFEVGSGVGLVGTCLAYVGASKVILTDGDISSLANMKSNLELNCLGSGTKARTKTSPDMIECKHLPWEFATESELQGCQPDIILGADVIYDPLCLPHLIQVLSILLKTKKHVPGEINDTTNKNTNNYIPCNDQMNETPVAYIAQVIRNYETFNYFLKLAEEADLCVVDITETKRPPNFLPYMLSYDRSSVHLYRLSFSCN